MTTTPVKKMLGLVQCECNGKICRISPSGRKLAFTLRYTCPGCKRPVPWCFGAADNKPELCDDCWDADGEEDCDGHRRTVESHALG